MATKTSARAARTVKTGGLSVQDKFFQLLEQRAADKNYQLVLKSDWANTGNGYIQPKLSFRNASQFSYDFQNSYANFKVNGTSVHAEYTTTIGRGSVSLDDVIDKIMDAVK